jgi:hypothetical protein
MSRKSKLDKIDHKIEKLIQLQDLSTIQTVLLAILFAILIFAITIILYYKDQNILVWLISWLVLLYDFWMFYWLICSIFSGDYETKFRYFNMTLLLLSLSGAIAFVTLIFSSINSMLNYSIVINNTIAVAILISVILIAIFLDRYLEYKVNERFYLILNERKKTKKPYQGKLAFIVKFIKKNRKNITYSGTISLLVTLLFGLWEWTSLRTPSKNYYGIPFAWIIEYVDRVPSLEYNYYALFGNWIIYAFIIFVLLLFYPYLKKFIHKEIKQKDKNQNIESWENDPAFIKYK